MSATTEAKPSRNGVSPIEYNLHLEPDMSSNSFTGSVKIGLKAISEVQVFNIDSADLGIDQVVWWHGLSPTESDSHKVVWNLDEQQQTVRLDLGQTIPAGHELTVRLDFRGTITDELNGLYRANYMGPDGVKQEFLVTKMEPCHARKVFPCFDDPAAKACFSIEVTVPNGRSCLSNMPVEKETSASEKTRFTFIKSPKMSTYLVAFVVGNLESIESTEESRVPIKLYAPHGLASQGHFALEMAAKGLRFFEETFGIPYPLPKLDLVAVPDFGSGAMENWGLITFRSSQLLLDPNDCSMARKKIVTATTLHEVSHQWFGNLVTMDGWNGLWLNEGFATWMSWYSINHFYPQWRIWEDYVAGTLQPALELDSLEGSHPVEFSVVHARDVEQAFDAISYKKGSSVLRMISKRLGEEVFLEGVRLYLQRHVFANASTNDLWDALQDSSGVDVRSQMSIWTRQIGFPVVSVVENVKGSKHCVTLKQSRYLSNGSEDTNQQSKLIYPVSILVRTRSGVQSYDLSTEETSFVIDDPTFFKINVDQVGFYRTAYSSDRLKTFGLASKEGLLSVEDRVGIVADAFALSMSGHQPTSGLLNLLNGMRDEPEYIVWFQMVRTLRILQRSFLFGDDKIRNGLAKFTHELLDGKLNEIGFDIQPDDDEILQQFKPLIYEQAGFAGNEKVITAANSMFKRYCDGDHAALPSALRDGTYAIVLANGGDAEFDALVNLYKTTTSEEEKWNVIGNLGAVTTPHLVQRTLDTIFTPLVKDQDIYLAIWLLYTSVAGTRGLWDWATKNWDRIVSSQSNNCLSLILGLLLGGFSTDEQIATADAFFSGKDTEKYKQTLTREMEKLRVRNTWVKRDSCQIIQWLEDNHYVN